MEYSQTNTEIMRVVRQRAREPQTARYKILHLNNMYVQVNNQELYHMLAYYYNQPKRHYHTLDRISIGLNELDKAKRVKGLIERPDELELAWWFHDAIHETWAKDNEKRSADLANFFVKDSVSSSP